MTFEFKICLALLGVLVVDVKILGAKRWRCGNKAVGND